MSTTACEKCGRPVELIAERCDTCDWPARPSNIRASEAPDEVDALDQRYRAAIERSRRRGCSEVVSRFENALAGSAAIVATSLQLIDALFADGKGLFSTYYQQLAGRSRPISPSDSRRREADARVFSGYAEKIHFATLSLDGRGLPSYGDAYLAANESLIAHRASVMDENSMLFSEQHPHYLPKGFRAPWSQRAKVAVAKLADEIESATPEDRFPGILLKPGATRDEDEFIEVHILGSMSIQTFTHISIRRMGYSRGFLRALRERLKRQGLVVEER